LTTVGALGVNAASYVGFDVAADGTASAVVSFPSALGPVRPTLYTVNLSTGQLTLVGRLGTSLSIIDVAAVLPSQPVYALTSGGKLAKFNAARPDVLISSRAITGLRTGESLLGIDFRPATGELYGAGSNGGIYVINPDTAVATLRTTLTADPADTTNPFTALRGTRFGVDFNPVPDRLRIVSDANQSLRVNVDTGA